MGDRRREMKYKKRREMCVEFSDACVIWDGFEDTTLWRGKGAGGRTRVNKDGKAFSCLKTASGWCREITVVKKNWSSIAKELESEDSELIWVDIGSHRQILRWGVS